MKDLYPCATFIVFASLSVGCGTQVREAGGRGDRHTSHFVITEITFRDHKQPETLIVKPKHFQLHHQITIDCFRSTEYCINMHVCFSWHQF